MKILIIDDNEEFCSSLRESFRRRDIACDIASNSRSALETMQRNPRDIIILDIMMGPESGMDLLEDLRQIHPEVPVIMITGYATIETAVNSIRLGAYDYVEKPIRFEELLGIVHNIERLKGLESENRELKMKIVGGTALVASSSSRISSLIDRAAKLATTDLPVLLLGENGTGKEVFAEFIHSQSSRSGQEMVKVNCAAFPEALLDNELFGHEKGAFTGADDRFVGVFEQADGTTLFLDEVGEMTPAIQAKILRVIQNQEIRRLGGNETLSVDVRFIAATNRDLEQMIKAGLFRQDLFFRLKAAGLSILPLRNRKEDILHLAERFLSDRAQDLGEPVKLLGEEVRSALLNYSWPGNIRELKNTIQYAAAMAGDRTISVMDLPMDIVEISKAEATGLLEESEVDVLQRTLQKVRFNKKAAAQSLGISRSTLYAKMRKYGIHS